MAIDFSREQQNAIDANGTVLVAAAAGSGKTAVLTERVVKKICDENSTTSLDRLLIVTFTNASALEMKNRIGERLNEYQALFPNNKKITNQKLLLRSAKICTIDSFCIDLVRNHFNLLDIDPKFSISTAGQTSAIRTKAVNNVLSRHYAESNNDFNSLCDYFNVFGSDKDLVSSLLSIYDFTLCMSSPDKWLENSVNNYFLTSLDNSTCFESVREYADIMISKAKNATDFIIQEIRGTEFEEKWLDSLHSNIELLDNLSKTISLKKWDLLFEAVENYKFPSYKITRKPNDKELLENIKDIRSKSDKSIKSICDFMGGRAHDVIKSLNETGRHLKTLVSLVREFSDEYLKLLKENNILTFSLVEQLALKLLCEQKGDKLVPSELSKDICKLYDEVLVDEYQDNNDLQDKLFYAISDEGKHLFMVGDVKQCIYAFRNAFPENFLKYQNDLPHYNEQDKTPKKSKILLSKNYRSRIGICNFVNGICRALIQKEACDLDYNGDEKLRFGATYIDNGMPAAELLVTDCEGVSVDRDIADAEAVADYIKTTISEKPFLNLKNNTNKTADNMFFRKPEYRDFVILLRSPNARVVHYIKALKDRNIPVVYNSGQFFDSPEILTAVSILKTIDNPTHDISFIATMSSVAFGFSFDEISFIKANYKSRNGSMYLAVLAAADDGNEKCRQMLVTIDNLRTSAVTLSVSRLIGYLYSITSLKEIFSSAVDGEQKLRNLSTLRSMADEYEAHSDSGISGFISYFEHCADEKSSVDKALQNDANAVRIISFHKSKGLQFPICIVAGCGNGFNLKDINNTVVMNAKHGVGIKSFENDGSKSGNIISRTVRNNALKSILAEELRLLYVAMTRAEERLVISITSNSYRKDLLDAVKSLGVVADLNGKVPIDSIMSAKGLKPMIISAALLQKNGCKMLKNTDISAFNYKGEGNFKFILNHPNVKTEGFTEIAELTTDNTLDEKVRTELDKRFNFLYKYQNETTVPSKMAVTALVNKNGKKYHFSKRPKFLVGSDKASLTPAEKGTALHKFMQFCNFERSEQNIENEISRLYEYEFLSEAEAESLDRESLKQFFNSSLYSKIKGADKVYREYKFMVNYDFNGCKTIIQGIADCIIISQDKVTVIDFKTDNVTCVEELKDRYSDQLHIYKKAVCEIFKTETADCIIYSLPLAQEIGV